MNRLIASVCIAFALAFLTTVAVRAAEKDSSVPDISILDLKKAIAEKSVVVLDANGSDSYKEGHIPGAIDFETSHAKLADLLPREKDALIVAYCGGPGCPLYKEAAKAATAMGYTNVKHLSAGISGWKRAGEKTDN